MPFLTKKTPRSGIVMLTNKSATTECAKTIAESAKMVVVAMGETEVIVVQCEMVYDGKRRSNWNARLLYIAAFSRQRIYIAAFSRQSSSQRSSIFKHLAVASKTI